MEGIEGKRGIMGIRRSKWREEEGKEGGGGGRKGSGGKWREEEEVERME